MTTSVSAARHAAAVLAIVIVSYLMIVVDASIVITGLPKIRDSFGLAAAELSWVQNAYLLAFGGLLLLGARAGDILGRRRMFVIGIAVFTLASLLIGLAPSAGWLIGARAVQGMGAAILAPSTLALLTANFAEGPERTRALSYYAAVAGIGASLGLVLGGIVADYISWRAGFFINVPIGIALAIAAQRALKETDRRTGRFDVSGAISSTLGMTALVYGIVRSASAGWGDTVTLASLAAGLVLLALFIINEARAPQPIMPLRLFTDRARNAAYAARFLYLGGMMGFWFFTTQFLQGVLGFSAFAAGIAFLPTTLPNFAAAMMVPVFSKRIGNGAVLAIGLTLTLAGVLWLATLSGASLYWTEVALPMVLVGLGQGLVLAPLTIAGVRGVSPQDAGAASGAVNVAHQIGGSLGLGTMVAVFAAGVDGPAGTAHLAHRIATAFGAGAVMLAVALILVVTFILRPSKAALPAPGLA